MSPEEIVPVITVDGPSGSGKGTVSRAVAVRLSWNFLDSGALYRLVALAARRRGVALDDEAALGVVASKLDARFTFDAATGAGGVYLEGGEVSVEVAGENCGADASRVAVLPAVRSALLARQRAFRRAPGLVADGRDMGTVVFPDAPLKIFLSASQSERAERRYKQLKEKGMDVRLDALFGEIVERDARDGGRSVSPMKPAPDAVTIDTTRMSVEEVVGSILNRWRGQSA